MGRAFLIAFLLVGVILLFIGCTEQMEEEEEMSEELMEMREEMIRRHLYAQNMWFVNSVGHDYHFRLAGPNDVVEIIFVHNEAEARELLTDPASWQEQEHIWENPPAAIAAWPDPERSQGVINGIHWHALFPPAPIFPQGPPPPPTNPEEFSLTFPLTLADLVDNWEKVEALINSLPRASSTQNSIRLTAHSEGADAYRRALEELQAERAPEERWVVK